MLPIRLTLTFTLATVAGCAAQPAAQPADIRSVRPDLEVPPMTLDQPGRGNRVREVIPEYAGTEVYHAIYLPRDWKPDRKYPVIVEYTGNGEYRNRFGDTCTGRVEDSKLGYGISAGKGCIWLCLPYLNEAGTANVIKWWGDKPTHRASTTVDYCKKAVPWICETYGGDPDRVVLAGFSRGSIACNFIGLHDDEIAKLWRAFIPYSVYDGVRPNWPYPGADRASALARLKRLGNRPQFICEEFSSPDSTISMQRTREYLAATGFEGNFTFRSTGFRNHNDAWVLRKSAARTELREWLERVLSQKE